MRRHGSGTPSTTVQTPMTRIDPPVGVPVGASTTTSLIPLPTLLPVGQRRRTSGGWRSFSSSNNDNINNNNDKNDNFKEQENAAEGGEIGVEPILNIDDVQDAIHKHVPAMAQGLYHSGYYTTSDFLPKHLIATLRAQSITLRTVRHRFVPSWSETVAADGVSILERFDKQGVYACEPDGQDYYDAPDLILYLSVLLQTLPAALNQEFQSLIQSASSSSSSSSSSSLYMELELSHQSFNAKLAVTEPGGSKYPLHIDNPQGVGVGDTRKLTCILYLNPDYDATVGGGELRLFLPPASDDDTVQKEEQQENNTATTTTSTTPTLTPTTGKLTTVDLTPDGGRLLVFWSDEIPHEVLPTAPYPISEEEGNNNSNKNNNKDHSRDRYALTIWIPTDNVAAIHNESSKFRNLKELAF
jgi:2OG-Fe(II) oxygenase superfamily